jgi:hypothetical protein
MQDDKYGLDAHVKLLIHSDTTDASTTFTDSSRLGTHTITASGGAQHKTAQYKFGATSMYFDGTGDYLSIPDHADFDFGIRDFTIETWCFTSTTSVGLCVLNQGTSVGNSRSWWLRFKYDTANKMCFAWSTDGTWQVKQLSDPDDFPTNQWVHVAVVRDNNTLRLYINGVQKASASESGSLYNASQNLYIGHDGGSGGYWNGYLDEIRISHLARWTENFTVPYKAYQDSTPALLTGGYTITGSGTIENGLIDSTDQWEGSTYINTLGTVLEGELTGNVKFPAGHVIQTISKRYPDIPNYSSTLTYYDVNLQPCAYHSITAKGNNSSFLVTWNAEYGRNVSGRSQWAIGDTWTSGVSSYTPTLLYFFYSHYGWYFSTNGDMMTSYSYHDKSQTLLIGGSVTYYIFLGAVSAGTDQANFQELQIMEIAG